MTIYKFRNCFLNTAERQVVRDGRFVELTPKTFDVLLLLVERSGEIVTKDEILGKVWNGSFVEEGNLPVHISKVRRSLDATGAERFIETVQGSGYRFIAPVSSVGEDEWRNQTSGNKRRQTDNSSAGLAFDSIAVLPLQNESNNPEIDYLADGLTESFINSLSRIPDLRVMARDTVFRYKNKDTEAKEVGETLGVAAVLTGRIKVIQDHLMISVELVKVTDGSQIWGTQFNQPFSDIFRIQEEIALAVSEKLRSELSHVAQVSDTGINTLAPESYRLYLKGKYFQEKRSESDIYKAIECFQKSILYDASNVYSYVETVECCLLLYFFDYMPLDQLLGRIQPLLLMISNLPQSVDVVQAMYGSIRLYVDWQFDDAEKHLRKALQLSPSCVNARYRYIQLLTLTGRFSEVLVEMNQILRIDPLSVLTYKRMGSIFYRTGQFENSLLYLEQALEMEPNDFDALLFFGAVLTEMGRYAEALSNFQKSLDINYNAETLSMIGYANARSGKIEAARKIIKRLETPKKGESENALKIARIHMALGEFEKSFHYMTLALEKRESDMIGLISDPRWSSIRHEPRFAAIVRQVGLPIT